MYVPASIRSGITLTSALWSFGTPSIVIFSVPAPFILAPMLLSNSAILDISASLAALFIVVIPFAIDAANMMFIVAPTDAKSKYISAPFNSSAVIMYFEFFLITLAPRLSKPFKCKLMGRVPILHPPGKYISTCLNLASKAPIK